MKLEEDKLFIQLEQILIDWLKSDNENTSHCIELMFPIIREAEETAFYSGRKRLDCDSFEDYKPLPEIRNYFDKSFYK